MLSNAIAPVPFNPHSFYSPVEPTIRAFRLPEIKSLPISDLLPDLPSPVYVYGTDLSVIRKTVRKSLENVDMSMIRPGQTVNILCSEHGFNIMGGKAYAEMLKTIRDVVMERTGCTRIRLRSAGGSVMLAEGRSTFLDYGLLEYFEGKAEAFTPLMEGLPLQTDIGEISVVKSAFDSDWFIHTSYSDPREIYFNRNISRVYKPFAMGYARAETRSAFHTAFGPRSSNVVAYAIFNALSDKHAFTVDMDVAPTGITGITANNDIAKVNREATIRILKNYGGMYRLFEKIDKVVAVLDGSRCAWYNHCGGTVFGVLLKAHKDLFDLDIVPRLSEGINGDKLKAIVVNNATAGGWGMLPSEYPTFVADQTSAMAQDGDLLVHATVCNGLQDAVNRAKEVSQCDQVMVFDGSFGYMNVSESMAKLLMENAPLARTEVDELMPKWLRSRGIDPTEL